MQKKIITYTKSSVFDKSILISTLISKLISTIGTFLTNMANYSMVKDLAKAESARKVLYYLFHTV